jgi:hypothetical protein
VLYSTQFFECLSGKLKGKNPTIKCLILKEGNRSPDFIFRSQTLYPTELRVRVGEGREKIYGSPSVVSSEGRVR